MDLFSAIDTRATAPKLRGPAPERKDLERILLSATHAPDHGRIAPWRFLVLENAARDILGDAMAALLREKSPAIGEEALASERAKAHRAPMIVVVAAKVNKAHKVPEIEQVMAVAAGVQNMMLAAHGLGYGAMWKTGDAAYSASVKSALGLATEDHIVAFVYLGTPAIAGRPREVSLEGAVRYF